MRENDCASSPVLVTWLRRRMPVPALRCASTNLLPVFFLGPQKSDWNQLVSLLSRTFVPRQPDEIFEFRSLR